MTQENAAFLHKQTASAFPSIIQAGLTAGTLDITAALISYFLRGGKEANQLFRFIASGVFGKTALSGGWSMAWLGLLFHYLIAFVFTLFFFFIYPKINWLSKNKLITGLLYGIFVWLVMNLVVVPLSQTPKLPFNLSRSLIGMMILMIAIGLPISYFAGKYYARK